MGKLNAVELISALGTSAGENLTAVGGAHSLSEAALLIALLFLRLECSEHFEIILSHF